MPSATSLPHKINFLRSRFKSSKTSNSSSEQTSNTTTKQLPPRSSSPPHSTCPSPVKVPPSSVGLDADPRSWVQSDDSDNESDDETLVKNLTAPTSLGDDDEVPLSRLQKQPSGGLVSSMGLNFPTSEAHARTLAPSRHHSSRSLHSLYKNSVTPTATPLRQLPSLKYGDQSGYPMNGGALPQLLQPTNRLRPAVSSPNLSRERAHSPATTYNLNSFPMRPALPLYAHSMVAPNPGLYTSIRGHSQAPSRSSQLGTPPSSISPPAKSHKLSSSRSSVSFRPSEKPSEKDVLRRMKQRHKEDLQHLHNNFPASAPIISIDPSLYSMLNDVQRSALQQRSDILSQNLKIHLESFAHEMIQANARQKNLGGIGAW